ncbi:MAG TPA: efflux RND transporter periplasmic adaptor subunit [Thermoanaerobaculia bacterium]|nr:efflux RND transporter periplasmic adaptor subunit [Thermoanaerobaculia bacterium]
MPLRWMRRDSAKKLGAAAVLLSALACRKAAAPPAPPPATVEVLSVATADVPVVKEWIGTLDGYVNAEIRPQVEGYLLRQDYREGSFVKRGTVLFEIDARQFQASLDQMRGELSRNQAALARAKLDVERFTPLVKEKAVSQQELDNALSAERQAQANVDAARANVERAQLSRDWSRVVSPIDGIAGIAKAQVGNLVSPQTLMTTVSQVDPIKVYFSPSEQEYLQWSQNGGLMGGGKGKGMLQLILSDGSEYPLRGDPLLQDRSIDPRTGTLQLAGVFPNPDRLLRPGQYARVRATTSVRHGAILVPQRAVTELQGNYQVAVVGPGNKVEIRPIQTADRIGSSWVVTKGLSPGERIVVEGTQKVRPGAVVDPRPAAPSQAAQQNGPGTASSGSVGAR